MIFTSSLDVMIMILILIIIIKMIKKIEWSLDHDHHSNHHKHPQCYDHDLDPHHNHQNNQLLRKALPCAAPPPLHLDHPRSKTAQKASGDNDDNQIMMIIIMINHFRYKGGSGRRSTVIQFKQTFRSFKGELKTKIVTLSLKIRVCKICKYITIKFSLLIWR